MMTDSRNEFRLKCYLTCSELFCYSTLATSLPRSPFQIHLSKYLSSLFNDSCLMCELHTTNLIISNDSVNLPCAVIRLGLCRTVGLTRTYYLTLLCVRWTNGLYKWNDKTLITFSIKVTVCKIKGDWFFLEIFIYLPPFFDNSKFPRDMIFLIFANGWKYRENRENQIPQNFQSHHTVTLA